MSPNEKDAPSLPEEVPGKWLGMVTPNTDKSQADICQSQHKWSASCPESVNNPWWCLSNVDTVSLEGCASFLERKSAQPLASLRSIQSPQFLPQLWSFSSWYSVQNKSNFSADLKLASNSLLPGMWITTNTSLGSVPIELPDSQS